MTTPNTASEPLPALGQDDVAAIDELRAFYAQLRGELGKVIIGQEAVVETPAIIPKQTTHRNVTIVAHNSAVARCRSFGFIDNIATDATFVKFGHHMVPLSRSSQKERV